MARKALKPDRAEPSQSVGSRIRGLRRAAGWTLEVLAERCGVHANYLGLLERGQKNPSLETLERVAAGLHVEVATLVDRTHGLNAAELRAIIRERIVAMNEDQLLRAVRILDAVR